MSEVQCPYCETGQEINHDDGYGYDEDEIYEQECGDCEKVFAYTTSIHFHYEAAKADCLNDGEHRYKRSITHPVEFTKMVCRDCGDYRRPTEDEMKQIIVERG